MRTEDFKSNIADDTYCTLSLPTRTNFVMKNKFGKKVWKLEVVNCITNENPWRSKQGEVWFQDIRVCASVNNKIKFFDISIKRDYTTAELYFEVFYGGVIWKVESIEGHDPFFFAPHIKELLK